LGLCDGIDAGAVAEDSGGDSISVGEATLEDVGSMIFAVSNVASVVIVVDDADKEGEDDNTDGGVNGFC
jgi:hypothetical protein